MCDTLKEELVSAVDRKDDKQVIELLKAGWFFTHVITILIAFYFGEIKLTEIDS